MEFNQTFNAKLVNDEISEDDAKSGLEKLTSQASRSSAPALSFLSQLQQKRSQRIEAAAGSLEKVLGSDHPQVAVLKQNAASSLEFKSFYKVQAERIEKRPKLRANQWMAFGRVYDTSGKPASGLTVRVFDKDRKFDDLLGDTETDENGDFSVVYHARDFYEKGENAPELYIMVEDSAGKTLFTSRENVRPDAGQSEYYSIQLSKVADAPAAKKRGRPSKVASKTAAGSVSGKAATKTKKAATARKTK